MLIVSIVAGALCGGLIGFTWAFYTLKASLWEVVRSLDIVAFDLRRVIVELEARDRMNSTTFSVSDDDEPPVSL